MLQRGSADNSILLHDICGVTYCQSQKTFVIVFEARLAKIAVKSSRLHMFFRKNDFEMQNHGRILRER